MDNRLRGLRSVCRSGRARLNCSIANSSCWPSRVDWELSNSTPSWLVIVVQLGFVVGAVNTAVTNLADRIAAFSGDVSTSTRVASLAAFDAPKPVCAGAGAGAGAGLLWGFWVVFLNCPTGIGQSAPARWPGRRSGRQWCLQ